MVKKKSSKESFNDECGLLDDSNNNNNNNSIIVGDKKIELKSASAFIHIFKKDLDLCNFRTNHDPCHKVLNPDIDKAEYVIMNDVLFILLNKSKIKINYDPNSLSDYFNGIEYNWFDDNVPITGDKVVILNNSNIGIVNIPQINGKSILSNTSIVSDALTIENITLISQYISGENAILKNTYMKNVSIISKRINISNSKINDVNINTKESIYINNFKPYLYTEIKTYSSLVSNKIRNLNIDPNHKIYLNEFELPSYPIINKTEGVDINIKTRLDYGKFSSLKDLKFVRCNHSDLLINNTYIDGNKIGEVLNRFKTEINAQNTNASGFQTPPDNTFYSLSVKEYNEIIKDIVKLALGRHFSTEEEYKVDKENQIPNILILKLIEQIAGRINIYKQINFLVD